MEIAGLLLSALVAAAWAQWTDYSELGAERFMKDYDRQSQERGSRRSYAQWDDDLTLSDETAARLDEVTKEYNDYQVKKYPEVKKFKWQTFRNKYLRRLFWMSSFLDEAALPKTDQEKLSKIEDDMLRRYNEGKVKEYGSSTRSPTLNIEEVQSRIASGTPDEKAYYWREWHDTVGRLEKKPFTEWIALQDKTAKLNGFENNAQRWQKDYETKNFEQEMARLYKEIEPYFTELHAYIRYKLWCAYGKNSTIIDPKGPIPASLLGNLWGLDAINVVNITWPYPETQTLDATPQLQAQNYTGLKMARAAEEFYVSMGMDRLPETFWKHSIFKRDGRNMDCSPVAYNFFSLKRPKDYRIHFCTSPTQDDYGRMYHEVGHVVQYMLYSDLYYFFQDAANPGMGEAFGDAMAILSLAPGHLKRKRLIDPGTRLDKEVLVNAVHFQAAADLFFLFYAYSLDLWRWGVMEGRITEENYNCEYWSLRVKLHGVGPPVEREEDDFDPGAKWHVAAGYQYISYFVSGILKYQFLKALCDDGCERGQTRTPLAFCDIFGNRRAGDKLRRTLALGKSVPWQDALEALTGQRQLDASALKEFYQPLYNFLKDYNKKNNVPRGWDIRDTRCNSKKKST